MNDDLSTQIPVTSDTEPAPDSSSKNWRWLSLLLIVGGVALVATGAWMYLQQYIEASKPPPARIVENSLVELEKTLTPPPTPTTRATASEQVDTQAAASVPEPTTTPLPTPSPASSLEETVTIKATSTPVELVEDSPTPQEDAEEEALSLADNPLLVVEEENEEPPAQETEGQPVVDGQPPNTEGSTVPDQIPLSRIVAEDISLDTDIIPVGWQKQMFNGEWVNVWTVADYAAGWHTNSMLPGQGGNVVLSGHHNIKGEVFRYILDLEPGAVVTVYDDQQQPFNYVIEDKFIVKDKGEPDAIRRANAKWIGPFNEERLTMVTCWPYNNNTHRVIVIGKPAEESQTVVQ